VPLAFMGLGHIIRLFTQGLNARVVVVRRSVSFPMPIAERPGSNRKKFEAKT